MLEPDKVEVKSAAQHLFQRTYAKGKLGKIWSILARHSGRLLNLNTFLATCILRDHHHIGTQTVPIRQIRGTENRASDFDINFHPLQAHDEERWISLAAVWMARKKLPPVRLIQVKDTYFVQDGHHRISVAQALGQEEIKATVTVQQVDCPLSGTEPTTIS